MQKKLDSIYRIIDDNREEMIELYKELVNLKSWGRDPENVNIAAQRLKEEFEKEGFNCRLVDVGSNGNTLVGILGEDRPGKPVIFSGHMDTALQSDMFEEEPFKIVDGKAYGPGVLDMKGGIIISLFVAKALNRIGYDEHPIKIVYSGDEEICHLNSKGAEAILEEAKDGLCAFNMETGLIDNNICVGRKGRLECHVTIEGVEVHAGNDFLSGRNAIEEMAYKIIEFQKLTDFEAGTTVSVGKIIGGTTANAIPRECKIHIDIRLEKMSEMDNIKQKVKEICEKTYIEGTTTKHEYVSEMGVYETTDAVMNFFNYVKDTAKEYGFGDLNCKRLGGSSDASYITMAGTPVLCSFGVQGQWNHTVREYAIVESLFERAKLISTVILNLKNYK